MKKCIQCEHIRYRTDYKRKGKGFRKTCIYCVEEYNIQHRLEKKEKLEYVGVQ